MTIQGLALELLEALRPGCERIEVAGSIRRGKKEPKDIELVVIAKYRDGYRTTLFADAAPRVSCLDDALDDLFELSGNWQFDITLKRNGPKYKRLRHRDTGVACDMFIVEPLAFGAQFVLRTGPAEFSHMLVTRALRLGMQQEGGQLWRVHRDDTKTVIPTPEERDYFAALGLPWIEPEQRGKATP